MDAVRCSQALARPRDGRTHCSRPATREGLCTLHANQRDRMGNAVAVPVANNLVNGIVHEVVHAPPPQFTRRKIVKAKRPSQMKFCGEIFECQICTEEKVPVEYDMELECGHKICSDCFGKLSDPNCPFCRVEMKSKKIKQKDIHNLETKAEKFKQDMEEETFQDWMRQDIEAMQANPAVLFERLLGLRIVAQRDPDWIESPEVGSNEDTACLVRMIDALCDGSISDAGEGDRNTHQQCHDVFPMYDCQYLYSLYNRASEVMDPDLE